MNEGGTSALTHGKHSDRLVALHQVEERAHRLAARRDEVGVLVEEQARIVLGDPHQLGLHLEVGDAEARQAGLGDADQVPRPAQAQILLGDAEAVLGRRA